MVLVIVSITLTFAILSFGDFGRERQRMMAAEKLKQNILLLEQYALVTSQSYGIKFNKNYYTFMRYQKKWVTLDKPSNFKPVYLPDDTVINLKSKSNQPDITLNPSLQSTPFMLTMGKAQLPPTIKMVGDGNGSVVITAIKDKP